MASFGNRKRKQNVRSSSCSSSVGSNENGIETGYISDNSNSDVEGSIGYHETGEKVGFPGKVGNQFPSQYNVLKKEFSLNIRGGKKHNESDEDYYKPSTKQPKCINRNAVNARLNRIKKKKYVEDLEKKIDNLENENSQLQDKVNQNDEVVKKLNVELKYLKSVLANSKEISMLLKSVRQNTDLPVTASINKYKSLETCKEPLLDSDCSDPIFSCGDLGSITDSDFLCSPLADKPVESLESASSSSIGICLHVAQHRVSLELCPMCSSNASESWLDNIG